MQFLVNRMAASLNNTVNYMDGTDKAVGMHVILNAMKNVKEFALTTESNIVDAPPLEYKGFVDLASHYVM